MICNKNRRILFFVNDTPKDVTRLFEVRIAEPTVRRWPAATLFHRRVIVLLRRTKKKEDDFVLQRRRREYRAGDKYCVFYCVLYDDV
jgi:hypothetical protein